MRRGMEAVAGADGIVGLSHGQSNDEAHLELFELSLLLCTIESVPQEPSDQAKGYDGDDCHWDDYDNVQDCNGRFGKF